MSCMIFQIDHQLSSSLSSFSLHAVRMSLKLGINPSSYKLNTSRRNASRSKSSIFVFLLSQGLFLAGLSSFPLVHFSLKMFPITLLDNPVAFAVLSHTLLMKLEFSVFSVLLFTFRIPMDTTY